jgi:hypothetical protein
MKHISFNPLSLSVEANFFTVTDCTGATAQKLRTEGEAINKQISSTTSSS